MFPNDYCEDANHPSLNGCVKDRTKVLTYGYRHGTPNKPGEDEYIPNRETGCVYKAADFPTIYMKLGEPFALSMCFDQRIVSPCGTIAHEPFSFCFHGSAPTAIVLGEFVGGAINPCQAQCPAPNPPELNEGMGESSVAQYVDVQLDAPAGNGVVRIGWGPDGATLLAWLRLPLEELQEAEFGLEGFESAGTEHSEFMVEGDYYKSFQLTGEPSVGPLEAKVTTGDWRIVFRVELPPRLPVLVSGTIEGGRGNDEGLQFSSNPIVNSTVIRTHGEGQVEADVYDVTGRLVKELSPVDEGGGSWRMVWDGTCANGSRATAGLYFVRVKDSREVRTGRVALTE